MSCMSCRDTQTVFLSQEQVLLTADCLGKQTKVCKILISAHFLKASKSCKMGSLQKTLKICKVNTLIYAELKVVHISVEKNMDLPLPRFPKTLRADTSMFFLPAGILAFLFTQTCTKPPLGNKTTLSAPT